MIVTSMENMGIWAACLLTVNSKAISIAGIQRFFVNILDFYSTNSIVGMFGIILRLSLYGSIAGIGVLFIGFLIDRLQAPRWIALVLWGLMALRLLCPFSVLSSISLLGIGNISGRIEQSLDFNRVSLGETKTIQDSDIYGKNKSAQDNDIEGGKVVKVGNSSAQTPLVREGKTTEIILTIAAFVWITGMAVLWCWAVFSYLCLKQKLRFAVKRTSRWEDIYETDAIASPCVVGILRPRIYLIPNLSKQQQEHIVLHEQMHISYLDYLWKFLSYLVISVHWFNPFLWILYNVFQGEVEKCCDERVLARIGADKKEDYSESLLALARERKWKLPSPIAFGEEDTKSRIKRILRYRKPVTIVSVFVAVLAVFVGTVFLTVPSANPKAGTLTEGTLIQEGISNLGTNTGDTTVGTMVNNETFSGKNLNSADKVNAVNTLSTENMDNSEVYEELLHNNVIYQAREDGIYCVKNGEMQQIYQGFPGVNTQMTVFEDCLYFLTDSTYIEGALDWRDNTIRWIDLKTLETGDLVLNIPVNSGGLPFITAFRMPNDGIVIVDCANPKELNATMQYDEGEMMFVDEEQVQVGVYTTMLYHKEETVLNGKRIDQLSKEEEQRLGMATTQALLQAPILANVSHRVRGQNIAYIDMDGDQTAEKIVLKPSPLQKDKDAVPGEPLRNYRLQVEDAYIDMYGDNTANTLWALHLGDTLLLAIYEDGPSADPYTRFFRYKNGQIIEVGAMDIDIHYCEVNSNGFLTAPLYREIVQSDWITIFIELDENGMLREVPQETYDFQKRNFIELYRELPLHRKINGEDTFVIPRQKVRFLKTSADWNWLLLETENGQQGWVHIVDYEVEELQENVMDVFGGVYLAG